MTEQPKLQLLFVCLGNICRSPTAEGVATKMLADRGLTERIQVDSAGTHGYHIGAAPDARAQEAALRRGIDLSGLRSRTVEPTDFQRFDLLLAMDQSNYENLEAMAARHGGNARVRRLLDYAGGGEVPDPYFGAGDGFERVLDIIESGCQGLLDRLEADGFKRV